MTLAAFLFGFTSVFAQFDFDEEDEDPRGSRVVPTVQAEAFRNPMKLTKSELGMINDPRIRDVYWYALNDTTDKKSYLRAHYAFNAWPDNWSFEVRGGVQSVNAVDFKEHFNVGPQIEMSFRKEIHPYWGARGTLTWSKYNHQIYTVHESTMIDNWEDRPNPWGSDWWQRIKYVNFGVNVAVMFNITNILAGHELVYDPFSFYLYGGAGACFSAKSLSERNGSCFVPYWFAGAEAGYNLTQRHMLTFDVHGSWQGDDMQGYQTQNSTWKTSVLVGLSYRFSRVIHFKRLGYDENFDRRPIFNGGGENGETPENILERYEKETEIKELPADLIEAAFFQIDRIELQHTYVLNLGFYAQLINSHPQQKFLVKGFADIEVGSMKRNLWLCEQRAKVVADVLIKTYNVNPEQLVVGGGDLDVDIPFLREQGHHKFNRCVIVCPLGKDYQIIKQKDFSDPFELNDRRTPAPNY